MQVGLSDPQAGYRLIVRGGPAYASSLKSGEWEKWKTCLDFCSGIDKLLKTFNQKILYAKCFDAADNLNFLKVSDDGVNLSPDFPAPNAGNISDCLRMTFEFASSIVNGIPP